MNHHPIIKNHHSIFNKNLQNVHRNPQAVSGCPGSPTPVAAFEGADFPPAPLRHLIDTCAPVFMGVKPSALVWLSAGDIWALKRLSLLCPLKMQPVDTPPGKPVDTAPEKTEDVPTADPGDILRGNWTTAYINSALPYGNLVFIYIPQLLEDAFRQPGALYVLRSIGYGGKYVEDYVRELVRRIQGAFRKKNLFPHEIGIFLGYPLEDVLGFWFSGGRGAKMEGEWKVYSDTARAEHIQYFHREAVKAVLTAVKAGYSLEDIIKYFWGVPGYFL